MGTRAALHLPPPHQAAHHGGGLTPPYRSQSAGHAHRLQLRAHGHAAGRRGAYLDGGRVRDSDLHALGPWRDAARWGPHRGGGERPGAHSRGRAIRVTDARRNGLDLRGAAGAGRIVASRKSEVASLTAYALRLAAISPRTDSART